MTASPYQPPRRERCPPVVIEDARWHRRDDMESLHSLFLSISKPHEQFNTVFGETHVSDFGAAAKPSFRDSITASEQQEGPRQTAGF